MKRLISILVCVFLITGGSAAALDKHTGSTGTAESPAAVMLSNSAAEKRPYYSPKDLDLLARLVQAEAGGEPFDGQVAVAATVLNRVNSARYPNTIPGVIYQWLGGYQYCPVRNGTIHKPAEKEARKAVQAALGGKDPTGGAVSFYNPALATNAWIHVRPVYVRIGNHVFVG